MKPLISTLIWTLFLSITCVILTACPLVRGTGNAVEAIGEGVGDAVSGTGEAIGQTGRQLANDPLN